MPISSTSTSSGTSQPAHRIRSPKAALQPRQVVPTPAPTDPLILAAHSIKARLQARRDRLAAAADPRSVQAKVVETCATVRRPHVPYVSRASRQIQGPPTPQAPRAVKFHDVGVRAAPIPILLNSTKALPKGILKRDDGDGLLKRKVVRFAEHFRQAKSEGGRVRGEIEWVKRVPRWIGVPVKPEEPRSDFQQHASVLEAQTKAEHVHPDPTRLLGRIQGWVGLDGQEEYLFGSDASSGAHAECQSPNCNKRRLHQWERKAILIKHGHLCLGGRSKMEHLPSGELIQHFNKRHGFHWSSSARTEPQYPKDRGL
ncbi:MAG: hypothetical protein LQ348_004641 [Seirophora lacunosa]|nr:MAG: hypothetical protein LQ348_004641 [Seirophora lacunosa]